MTMIPKHTVNVVRSSKKDHTMKHFVQNILYIFYIYYAYILYFQVSFYVSDNSLHIFPIFLAKYREMKLGSRLLHSTVHVLNVDKKEPH